MIKYLALPLILLSMGASAQSCKLDSIPSSHKSGQYLDNNDGTITDIVNGIVWLKCTLGQSYVDGKCEGTPLNVRSWKDALNTAQLYSVNNNEHFQLPNIKELSSLVERACNGPSINLEAFPSTPSAVYWSNTPDSQVNISVDSEVTGRIIDFSDGTEFLTEVNDVRMIRLMRKL